MQDVFVVHCAAEIAEGKDLLRFVSHPGLVITIEGHLQVQTFIVTVLIFISTSMPAKNMKICTTQNSLLYVKGYFVIRGVCSMSLLLAVLCEYPQNTQNYV